ncbi:hypothetical protein F5B17DRAFT_210722 [Nemania serpens]|nr:hypothetical protein F5B17DRAFT_210722 [Nemania serpens]
MSYNHQLLMSGIYHFDLPSGGGGRGPSFAGVHPGIFRPPTSPSLSSSTYLGRSTASLQSETPTPLYQAKRKRGGDWATPGDGNGSRDTIMDDRSYFDMTTYGSAGRYVLAGQIETPDGNAQKELGQMEESVYSDVDYRRALGSKRYCDDGLDSPASRPVIIDSGNQTSSGGWSSFAISTIGGVVGKVWEFCKNGPFRGFSAGGGRAYAISDDTRQQQSIRHRDSSPPYDNIPQPDYAPYSYERDTPESTPPPAPKRRQISYGTPTDELRKNWVMIDEPANVNRQPPLASRASSRRPVPRTAAPPPLVRRISKPVSRLSNAPSSNRRPPSRPSLASSVPISTREPASFASTRSPAASPDPRAQMASRIPVASRAQSPSLAPAGRFSEQSSSASRIPSPSPYSSQRGHRRSQSALSTSSASVSPTKMMKKREPIHEIQDNSPRLDAKGRNLAVQRMKKEMETDMRINDFNARLRDMIRQGKEALGTTYEVELDDEGDPEGGMWESDA